MGSSRRPGKIAALLQGEAMLAYQIKRLTGAGIRNVVVATSQTPDDDRTAEIARAAGVACFRGSENDLIDRYLQCARQFGFTEIARVTGDDPLVDPCCLPHLHKLHRAEGLDAIFTTHPQGWIYGTSVDFITTKALERADHEARSDLYREHVIPYFKASDGLATAYASPPDPDEIRPDIFVSVDYQEDLDLIAQILEIFTQEGRRYDFTQKDLIALFDSGRLEINNRHLHSGF
ncbi:hypothetical protein BV394_15960 (plasmid) [Brevirhabdus pacifica]|uniref:Spore coat polysaccharide biosynthesis protein SpsF n=2 Tax=Brevirhabdus pacifica TaxID=1267768 RepID=A0A1P8QY99_9RHOB|nr:hypothetical protein BV394_15960 [Brevirhabdus pacifica]